MRITPLPPSRRSLFTLVAPFGAGRVRPWVDLVGLDGLCLGSFLTPPLGLGLFASSTSNGLPLGALLRLGLTYSEA